MAKKYRKINESKRLEIYDLEGNLANINVRLQEWIKLYGGGACMYIDVSDCYHGDPAEITISWTRSENDEEYTKRLANNKKERERRKKDAITAKEKERLEYLRLKDIYDG